MPNFTAEQQLAIDTRGCELLVAAAAGSGKTAVLVERIIKIIEKPVDIDRLLVVTFTDAAAMEMRRRVAEAIYKKLEPDSGLNAKAREHFRRQSVLLGRAQITTIHSFCMNVVRRNFHLLDIDPNFRIADDAEGKLLQAEILDELFEDAYNKEDAAFTDLVECYGGGNLRDDGLKDLVLEIFEFVNNSARPAENLRAFTEMYDSAKNLDATKWAGVIKEELVLELDGILSGVETAIGLANLPGGPAKYLPALNDDLVTVNDISARLCSLEKLYDYLNELPDFTKLPSYTKKDVFSAELKERVQDIRKKEIKGGVDKLKDLFAKPPREMLADIASLAPRISALAALVSEFLARYAAAKKEKNLADFADLEHFCLRVLLNEDDSPSPVALVLRDKYEEILIDEYQDSNEVQELILISVAKNNRFMVGDIKQSIYKFRRAMPELFLEKYKTFKTDRNDEGGFRIDLSKNFRSRACVLGAVNFLFGRLMIGDETDITYDGAAALYLGREFPDTEKQTAAKVEVYLIEHGQGETDEAEKDAAEGTTPPSGHPSNGGELEVSKTRLEGELIAARIRELTAGEFHILDGDAYRPARYGDIVILVRSFSAVADELVETLKQNGIPAAAQTGGGGFYETVEISTALSFLQVIDNPRQDIHLITVLHSPVYEVTPDELLEVRFTNGKSFYDCIKNSDNEKIIRFLGDLQKFRAQAAYLPVSKLLTNLYEETGYYYLVGAMPNGAARQANLRALKNRAVQYEKTSYKGLFHFVKFVEKMKSRGLDSAEAANLSAGNAVTVMSVHKSKGLEFPIVFAATLGRAFNKQDERAAVQLHRELGVGSVYIDLKNRVRSNTLPRMAISKKIRRENISEELRVLYVALTRAKELLILTGTARDLAKAEEKYSRFAESPNTALPAFAIFGAGCYMDWVMHCLAKSGGEAERLFEVHKLTAREVMEKSAATELTQTLASRERAETAAEDLAFFSAFGTGLTAETLASLNWSYPFAHESLLPQKITISEMKRIFQREIISNAEEFPRARDVINRSHLIELPEFMKETTAFTGAHRGTILHTVLEHLDLHKQNTAADIESVVASLVGKNLLDPNEAAAVPVGKLVKFSASPLAARMRESENLRREEMFVIGLSPYEIYRQPNYLNSTRVVLVHGIIDCYFEERGEIVLVDYKTDYVGGADDITEIKKRYELQMNVYKNAIERGAGKKVKERYLYLFGIDKAILL